MSPEGRVRLQHILDAVAEVETFIRGRTYEALLVDTMLLRALSMSIGIIGEAASRLSSELRHAHPHIPWPKIIAMRNFVFHAYFKVDPKILWDTAAQSVPLLASQIADLLNQTPS